MKTAEVILAEQNLATAQARQAEQQKQELKQQYAALARQHRAAAGNVNRLRASFDRAEAAVAQAFQSALTAESHLAEHNAHYAAVEFPDEEETTPYNAKRSALEGTLGQKRAAVVAAKGKRDAIRIDCMNEDARRAQLEHSLRNIKAALAGERLGKLVGGVYGLEDGREVKL
jgi:hypothetical protein